MVRILSRGTPRSWTDASMTSANTPWGPIPPMLAKTADTLPQGDEFLFEPKWDGFRAIVFCSGGLVHIQSRDSKPLDRYFPELHAHFAATLPDGCVLDGVLVGAAAASASFPPLVGPITMRVGDEEVFWHVGDGGLYENSGIETCLGCVTT